MAEKLLNTRIQQKHDIEANWLKAVNFIPKVGEVIVYDIDETHTTPRMKIGDGVKNINELEFIGNDSPAIIDVVELPETDIDEDVFYRMLNGTFYFNGTPQANWTCYLVETLPAMGVPVTTDMVHVALYYAIDTQAVSGYVPDALAGAVGVPAGWYPVEVLGQAFGLAWGGIISDESEDPIDDANRLVLKYSVYYFKQKWVNLSDKVGWRSAGGAGAEVFNSLKNKAIGNCSHAEGYSSHAEGYYSHAEGYSSHAEGDSSHAEGGSSHAEGYYSHAEGDSSHAEGDSSHAEGRGAHFALSLTGDSNATTYSSVSSLPSNMYVGMIARMRRYGENAGNEVGVTYSTAKVVSFDTDTKTITFNRTLSDIAVSDAYTIFYYAGMALGDNSHVEGYQNIAAGRSQHVEGEFNIQDPEYNADNRNARGKYVHVVGNGTSHTNRSNAHTIDWDGNAWFSGDVYVGSTSGTDKDEGSQKLVTMAELQAAIPEIEAITTDEIDTICGTVLYAASEVLL